MKKKKKKNLKSSASAFAATFPHTETFFVCFVSHSKRPGISPITHPRAYLPNYLHPPQLFQHPNAPFQPPHNPPTLIPPRPSPRHLSHPLTHLHQRVHQHRHRHNRNIDLRPSPLSASRHQCPQSAILGVHYHNENDLGAARSRRS